MQLEHRHIVIRAALAVAIAGIIAGFILDPYAEGWSTYDDHTQRIFSQVLVTILSSLLLIASVFAIAIRAWRAAMFLVITESIIFLAANAVYFGNDGTNRITLGFDGSTHLGWILGATLLLRVAVIFATARLRSEGPSVN
jgi:hypothetical protein